MLEGFNEQVLPWVNDTYAQVSMQVVDFPAKYPLWTALIGLVVGWILNRYLQGGKKVQVALKAPPARQRLGARLEEVIASSNGFNCKDGLLHGEFENGNTVNIYYDRRQRITDIEKVHTFEEKEGAKVSKREIRTPLWSLLDNKSKKRMQKIFNHTLTAVKARKAQDEENRRESKAEGILHDFASKMRLA